VLLVGSALLLIMPRVFDGGAGALLVFGGPLLALVFFPATPAALRVLLLWFAVPFIAHAFLIADPRTHFYTLDAAAALLVALAVVRLVAWLREHRRGAWLLAPLAAGGVALLLLSVPYLYLVFVQQQPEYYRSFPAARPDIYRAAYGDEVPEGGHFGFPHRDGWKVIGELYQQGYLQGSYDTNQRDRIGIWYTRGAFVCPQQPDYYLLATWDGATLEGKNSAPPDAAAYSTAACVLVGNQRMLSIYTHEPGEQPPQPFRLEDYRAAFDARPVPDFPMQDALLQRVPQERLHAAWPGGIRLVGYDLNQQRLHAAQTATLALHWRVEQAPTAPLELVIDMVDSNGILVRGVSPLCSPPAPAAWSPLYITTTAFTVQLDNALRPGSYTLRARLRHRETGALLPLLDGAENASIATVTVEEP
jgi:hypothetical protein